MQTNRFFDFRPVWPDGILIARVFAGLLVAFHGVVIFMPDLMTYNAKMVEKSHLPFPLVAAYLAKFIELVSGLCLALGLFTRLNAILLVIVFTLLTFVIHDGNILNQQTVHPFLFLLLFLVFFFNGPGKISLDYKLRKRVS